MRVRWQPADFVDDVYIDIVEEKETAQYITGEVEIKSRTCARILRYCAWQDIIALRY